MAISMLCCVSKAFSWELCYHSGNRVHCSSNVSMSWCHFAILCDLFDLVTPLISVTLLPKAQQHIHCVRKKKSLQYCMCNFNKFKDIFIIFGRNHPETPLY